MSSERSRRGAGLPRLAAALAAAAALTASLGAPPAAAQQEVSAPTDVEGGGRGWLGVGLISFTECLEGPDAPEDECRHTLVVGGVVHGGPADRAGVQPGDTLIAVGDTRLDGGLEDRSFGRLNPGDTVPVLVGRPDGRVRLQAVPTARPDSLAIVRYHRDGPYVEDRSHYLLAIPERRVLDSLVASASRDPNVTVRTRISVVPTERVKKIPLRPGTGETARVRAEARERMAEVRARSRQLRREAIEELRERTGGAPPAPLPPDAEEWKRWVSEELQPRLQVIYDSVLAVARDRMDSLRALYPGAAARAAEAMDSLSAAARAVEAREIPPPARPSGAGEVPPPPEALGMAGNRIAGAELQPLGPELGEFFGGVERGLVVLQVLRGTPADRLGLRPGDVIVEAAGHPVTSVTGLRHALTEHASGVGIRWIRRGRSMADTLRH